MEHSNNGKVGAGGDRVVRGEKLLLHANPGAVGDARAGAAVPPRPQNVAINDDAAACRKAAANDALNALVADLSGELHAEAERVIVEARQKSDGLLAERDEVIARLGTEVEAIRATLEHTDTALRTKTTECANALEQLEERTLAAAHLEERACGLERELATQHRCVEALEQECERWRTTFERHQVAEKDHQEQVRRDDAQRAQELQKALNQANDALKAKTQEWAALDRSNARHAQQSDDQDKRLHQLEQDRQRLLSETKNYQAVVNERVKLQDRVEQATRDRERAEREAADARATMEKERTARQSAELALARSQARAQTLELVIAELRVGLTARHEPLAGESVSADGFRHS